MPKILSVKKIQVFMGREIKNPGLGIKFQTFSRFFSRSVEKFHTFFQVFEVLGKIPVFFPRRVVSKYVHCVCCSCVRPTVQPCISAVHSLPARLETWAGICCSHSSQAECIQRLHSKVFSYFPIYVGIVHSFYLLLAKMMSAT